MSYLGTLAGRLKGWIHAASPAATRREALETIVTPQARDRWLYSNARSYTPDTIESTLRGAFAGDLTAVWQLYDLMESTWPRLSKNLAELKDSVASLDWQVQPWAMKGEQPTPEATKRAQLLDQVIWSMRPNVAADENDFRGTVRDMLDAWGKGIAVLETHWELRQDLAIYAPRTTTWVHPRYYGYPTDGHEMMLNMREVQASSLKPAPATHSWSPFPREKFVVCIAKQKSGHPAGAALLRPLAWWWCAANFSASWFLNFAQIFGLPIRWANYDPNVPGLLDQVCDMLENMGSAGWGAFPAGTSLELKESAKSGTDNPQLSLLDRADTQCDLLILGQTLTSDVGDSGSRALGEVHEGILAGRKACAKDWVASVLSQQLATAFCQLNWGDTRECPWFLAEVDSGETPQQLAERDRVLLEAGFVLPKEWAYSRHGIPVPGPDEEVITKPQPAAMPTFGSMPTPPPTDDRDADLDAKAGIVHARDAATDRLVDNVLEDLTGVEARWLGGVKPWFRALVISAEDKNLSDEQFAEVLAKAQRELPELFGQLDHEAVSDALEKAMGAAMVNGAVRGHMQRRRR